MFSENRAGKFFSSNKLFFGGPGDPSPEQINPPDVKGQGVGGDPPESPPNASPPASSNSIEDPGKNWVKWELNGGKLLRKVWRGRVRFGKYFAKHYFFGGSK